MIDPRTLDDITRRLGEALPPGLHALRKDLEKTFHGVLQGAFHSMNLVNREEFEVQSAVLARTRARLEAMEARVAELEKALLDR
jgi:BMFP domain-containing protein YqiC